MNNLQGFVSEGATIDAERVIHKAGLRGWRFTATSATQGALAAHHYEGTLVEAPLVDLSEGYESYFAGRSKKFLSDYNRKWRALERDVGPVSLEWGTTELEPVRQLIDWQCARYAGARFLFADAATRSIVEELGTSASEDCRGVVNVLRAGDQVVAVSSHLTCPGVLCGWFVAYDHDLKKYSPGTTVMIATLEGAERCHITRVDMCAGQDFYKNRISSLLVPDRRGYRAGDPRRARGARSLPALARVRLVRGRRHRVHYQSEWPWQCK
jgi:CelD/BcsL family acetyltransferase involved in cellulose biosynthesis